MLQTMSEFMRAVPPSALRPVVRNVLKVAAILTAFLTNAQYGMAAPTPVTVTLVSGVPDVVDPNMPFSFDLSATVSGADPSISQCTSNVTWTWAIASVEYSSDNVTWGAAPVGGSYALMIVGSSDPSDSSATLMGEFSPPGYYAVQLTASVSNTGTDCSGPWNGSDTEYVGGPDTGATGGGGSGAAYRRSGRKNRLVTLSDEVRSSTPSQGLGSLVRSAEWVPSPNRPRLNLVQAGGGAPPDEILVPGGFINNNPTTAQIVDYVIQCAQANAGQGYVGFGKCLAGKVGLSWLKANSELIVCMADSLWNSNLQKVDQPGGNCTPWSVDLTTGHYSGPCEFRKQDPKTGQQTVVDGTHCQECCSVQDDWCVWSGGGGLCNTTLEVCFMKCPEPTPN